jgi:hypothetical protein
MTDHRQPAAPGDEPPFVLNLLTRAAQQSSEFIRGVAGKMGRQLQMKIWGFGTVAIFVGLLVLSFAQAPDWSAVASGVFASFFAALLFAVGMGWFVLSLNRTPKTAAPAAQQQATELETLLAPTLRELNAARGEVIRRVKERSVFRVPAGIVGAVVFWVISLWNDDPPGVLDLIIWCIVGAVLGEVWAIGKLDRDYRRLYKQRVLPELAKRFGDLTYRPASDRNVVATIGRILKDYDRVKAEDEIAGTYHGMAVSIVEARLESGAGDKTRVIFDGLLIELTLPRNLSGTTVIMPDGGLVGNLGAQWRSDGLQRVRLEDPRFEKLYEVYSTDQIESRALLTPAFMERFMGLARLSGLAPPGAVAEGNRLATALPKRMRTDLFEPPPYWKASGGRELLALSEDIGSVLKMVDAVIEVDFWARGRKNLPT